MLDPIQYMCIPVGMLVGAGIGAGIFLESNRPGVKKSGFEIPSGIQKKVLTCAKSNTMREFIVKYFGRILAILGCSTVVTACYGVPTASFTYKGKVVDAETGDPIKGIFVSVKPGYGQGTSRETGDVYVRCYEYIDSESFTVECHDNDGEENGSYETTTGTFPFEQSQDFVIEMSPKK